MIIFICDWLEYVLNLINSLANKRVSFKQSTRSPILSILENTNTCISYLITAKRSSTIVIVCIVIVWYWQDGVHYFESYTHWQIIYK